jgi:hypothetical protein
MTSTESLTIGGEFELTVSSFSQPASYTPPSLPTPHAKWTNSGRAAMLLSALDILRHGGAPVAWLPAFCCRSVAQAFQQAGFELHYYSAAELHGESGALPQPRSGETFVFVHYFGHPNAMRLAQVREWKASGVHIVEDAVQASLSDQVGNAGHYAVTSLRKFSPQPDGALLGSEYPLDGDLADADEEFVSGKATAKLMRGAGADSELFLALINSCEQRLDDGPIVPRRISWLSRELMSRTDFGVIARRRRQNWKLVRAGLAALRTEAIAVVIDGLEEDEAPLGLPVRLSCGRRDALRQYLGQHSVYCPVHWDLSHVPAEPELAPDHRLAKEILTLPVDQRMGVRHVSKLCLLLEQFIMDAA